MSDPLKLYLVFSYELGYVSQARVPRRKSQQEALPGQEPKLSICFLTSSTLGGTAPKSDLFGKHPTEARFLETREGISFVHPFIRLAKVLNTGDTKMIWPGS